MKENDKNSLGKLCLQFTALTDFVVQCG